MVSGLILSPLPVGAWAFLGLTTSIMTKTLTFTTAFSTFMNEMEEELCKSRCRLHKALMIGDLLYWMEESYIHRCFAQSGEHQVSRMDVFIPEEYVVTRRREMVKKKKLLVVQSERGLETVVSSSFSRTQIENSGHLASPAVKSPESPSDLIFSCFTP